MKSLAMALLLCGLVTACTSGSGSAPLVKTPAVPLAEVEILRAEDSRNPHALLQLAASLNFDRPGQAARLAIAAGRIPSFKTWRLLAEQFGSDPEVARALAVAARFPDTGFPVAETMDVLLTLPPCAAVVETLVGLDSPPALAAARSRKSFQREVARNLWRAKSVVNREMVIHSFRRFPVETVISIARLKMKGILTGKALSRMPWPQRMFGCAVCEDPDFFLKDSVWQVRVAALRSSVHAEKVRPLLVDPIPLVREEALRNLLRLDPQWQPADILRLTPREEEILAAAPATPTETVEAIFRRGGVHAEVSAPFMPAEEAATVLGSPVSQHARIRFLANRLGKDRAMTEAAKIFSRENSVYALEYLLSQKKGEERNALAEIARARGGFTSVLADYGYTPPNPAPPPLTQYARALANLRRYRGFRIHSSRGVMECRFFPDQAPLTCASFIHLAREGFFDGLRIHRVVPAFVTQDGDPTGSGSGGPGYTIRCEYNELEYDRAGRVGMALAGKDTGGSQYFITHAPAPHLNHRYTIFAQVEKGLDVLARLSQYDRINRIELR